MNTNGGRTLAEKDLWKLSFQSLVLGCFALLLREIGELLFYVYVHSEAFEVLYILALLFLVMTFAVAAVGRGYPAIRRARATGGRIRGAIAIVGTVFGGVAALMVTLSAADALLIFAHRSDVPRNEKYAAESLYVLGDANQRFAEAHGGTYASTLPELRGFVSTQRLSLDKDLSRSVGSVLSVGSNASYLFKYSPIDADGDGKVDGYALSASPLRPRTTGVLFMLIDEGGAIHYRTDAPATKSDPIL